MSSSKRSFGPPCHQWTGRQTIKLLEAIDGSQTYIDALYPNPKSVPYRNSQAEQDRLSIRMALERELCMIILEDSNWMRWMLKNGKIVDGPDGLIWAADEHNDIQDNSNPVRLMLDSLDEKSEQLDSKLAKARAIQNDAESYAMECRVRDDHRRLCDLDWFPIYSRIKSLNHPYWMPRNSRPAKQDAFLSSFAPSTRTPSSITSAAPARSPRVSSSSKKRLSSPIASSHAILETPNQPAHRIFKKAKVYPITPGPSSFTSIGRRLGRKSGTPISISSDSDDGDIIQTPDNTIEIDSSDEDDIVITGFKSSARKPFLRPSPSLSPSPPPDERSKDFFVRRYTRTTERVGYLTSLNESENLQAIRRLSGPIMNRHTVSDSESETDGHAIQFQSKSPIRPRSAIVSAPESGVEVNDRSWEDLIAPHFLEDMFRDTSIRSHRLDLLHARMGLPSVERDAPLARGAQSPPLVLNAQDDIDEETNNSHGVFYPPLIITDGTLEDYPIPIEGSPELTDQDSRELNKGPRDQVVVVV
ncbi:uncharacterized protein I303_106643 [Kwoniella dejecticola CBS 10117]|uniref:Uncharacterized protein n=1 Tax=Kwoniella dejecticola CBS 10117 TaxID=1296121 RepID=A0A1A5ZU37_9TREE|nr:uncharacterized protein I303_08714 [Kwoniella dejecticola CBS 10117]OBR81327.1 hypothetical protein I303_08714 [Kwoniella dejecticola CBS 10117]